MLTFSPDLPPVEGYTSPNNNSLIDWHQKKAVARLYSRIVCKDQQSYQVI